MPSSGAPSNPQVSVIIPVYNGEKFIRQCVSSILASNIPSGMMEVICVDNGSTDRTFAILKSFEPAIQVLQARTRGAGAARNVGMLQASGVYLAFTDADCIVHPDWAVKMVEPLRDDKADAVGGRILARPQAGPVERFGEFIHDHQRAIEVEELPYIISMSLAMRRDLLIAVNGFDERWLRMQDGDLSVRLIDYGCRLRYCHDALTYHHNRDTLYTLAREGYIHGKYGSAFWVVIKDRYDELVQKARSVSTPVERYTAPSPRLSRWQIAFFWALFKAGKRLGKIKGRFFPPVIID